MKKILLLFCVCPPMVMMAQNIFQSGANVGIGTAAPARKLHVAGNLMLNSLSQASSGETDAMIFAKDHTAGGGSVYSLGEIRSFTSNGYAGGLNFYTGRSLLYGEYGPVFAMRLDEKGYLGIGTTSPAAKLTVEGDFQGNENVLRVNNQGDYASRIWLRNSGQSAYFSLSGTTADDASSGILSKALSLGVHNNSPIQFFNGLTPSVKMTIDNAGKVGIGTTSPAQPLDVNGAIQTSDGAGLVLANSLNAVAGSAIVYGYISRTGGGGTSYPWDTHGTIVMQASSYGGGYPSSGGFAFLTGDAGTVKMNILNNGNVGIGTISPTEKLCVNGSIKANGHVVTKKLIVSETAAWPDYVFDADYQLQSLPAIEQFIKKNKHLPGMPPAKEVKANGINVGDNQSLLLQKIEELTLHMIEMKKEIVALQNENKRLKKE
jgi:hypothetical protein